MSLIYRILWTMLGLTIANFAYQASGDHNWVLAIDRTFFQYCALLSFWILCHKDIDEALLATEEDDE